MKLETPRTPTFLAKDLGINLANVSRALTELESKDVVICLTPKQKVGKIYSMTKKGKDIVSQMKKMEEWSIYNSISSDVYPTNAYISDSEESNFLEFSINRLYSSHFELIE